MNRKDGPSGETSELDLVVVGAGGAGMAAALFGAIAGLRVMLLEKTGQVGGTTAFAAGTVWIPNTLHAATVNPQDSAELAARYLDRVVGSYSDRRSRQAFLDAGPRAVTVLERSSHVKLRPYALHPDYESDLEGATLNGRALEPVPFDGRLLGERFDLLRPPIPEFTVFGGMMVDRSDIAHLLGARRSWESARYTAKIVGRHLRDRLTYPRGTRLVMGNALCARLLYSLIERGVPIWTEAQVESLDLHDGGIRGVTLLRGGVRHRLRADGGVVLASGGFNRHPALRERLLPAETSYTPGAPGHSGEALSLALAAGARLGEGNLDHAFWAPVSVRRRADGSIAVFPHFVLDRAKPGTVVVNRTGRRFVNESTSYHRFARAMFTAHKETPSIPAFLIADARALTAYGLGMVRPGGRGCDGFLADGYLVAGRTVRELAERLGIDASGLEQTVGRMNEYATSGVDPEYQRGTTDYQRNLGDKAFRPNPTLGPIATAPFYAVRLYPGDIGASTGLVTDASARVLGPNGQPIAGLYAVGNDMNSIMGGTYPAPGITLGPALAFAYIAVQDIAARLAERPAVAGPGVQIPSRTPAI